jgi:two-component system response regulator LytT
MTEKIKAIVIDDEPFSRDELKHLLSKYPFIDVIAEAESGEIGLAKALSLSPDVLFVDIEMHDLSGIELAKRLQDFKKAPRIIFATAYPDYAVKAFRYDAVDYLLKPFSEEELDVTISRLQTKLSEQGGKKELSTGKLAVELDEKIIFLDPKIIGYCTCIDRSTLIYANSKMYKTKLSLKDLEKKLSSYPFFRTHKSFLVNLLRVEHLTPWFNGAFQLKLEGLKEEIPVSRNYVKALREMLEL